MKKSLFLATLSLFLLFQGCSDSTQEDAQKLVATSDFVMTDTYNQPLTVQKSGNGFVVKGHENKVILFDIFATWCPPCQATAAHLTSLQKKYPNDLFVLGVTIEDDISHADLEQFKTDNGGEYTIVNSPVNEQLTRAIASAIKVGQRYPIPLMVMYKNGRYYTHYVGATPEEMIESDIKQLLGQ